MIIHSIKEFCKFFQLGKPILGIDHGMKKIGLAISTPNHTLSTPLKIVKNNSEKQNLQEIIKITLDKKICAIIIGLPINMDGTKSDQTLIVEKFAAKLQSHTDLPIFMQDERLTSKAADNFLKIFNIKRKNRNNMDDLTAASMILETSLESTKKLLAQ